MLDLRIALQVYIIMDKTQIMHKAEQIQRQETLLKFEHVRMGDLLWL